MADNSLEILIAEDEPAHAEAIVRSLRSRHPGARLQVASSLQQYRSFASESPPDIAIVDMNLPDGRAVDVLTSPADAGRFPVLVMTSYGNEQVAVEALRAGALDYIVKSPEAFMTMPRTVERALREWVLLGARRRDEARIKHLNAVLRGIRNVNQLITRERDPKALIRKACEMLVESRGFISAAIVLIRGQQVVDVAGAGSQPEVDGFRRLLGGGTLPACIRAVLESATFQRKHSLEACRQCPLSHEEWSERDAVAVPLRSEGQSFGALIVSLPYGLADDPEELDLLDEVAGDVAYALRHLEIEKHLELAAREHREVENRLKESEERFRAAFDQASIARSLTQPDGRLTRVNRKLCELLGYSAEELASLTFAQITHPDDLQESLDRVQSLLTGEEQSFNIEKRYLHRDGHVVWTEVSTTLLRDEQGAPINFVTDILDITQRKAAQESQRRFNSQLEQLARVVRDLSEARALDEIIDIVKHGARALVGSDGATFVLREGDFCRYVDEDAISPLWKGSRFPMEACVSGWVMRESSPAIIEDIFEDDRVPHDAYRTTFVKSLAMVPIGRQPAIGAIGTYWASRYRATPEDMRILLALADSASVAMENVRHVQELQESEARTRAIYEHLPNPALVWKRRGAELFLEDFNEAASTLTGGAIERVIGRPPTELEEACAHLAEDLQTCFDQQTTVRREEDCSLPGAPSRRRMMLTYSYIPADMVMLHAEDVTEQRQTEERLRVSQRLEAVGRLAGGVAHDFNNLLSVIINYAAFGVSEVGDNDALRGYFEEIQTAGDRAASLTHQLLAFSRKQLLQPEVINLNRTIEDLQRMLTRLLGEDIRIESHLAEGLGNVTADPGQIEQVLMNLAVNARDAMLDGGTLTIETANVELDETYADGHVGVSPGSYVMMSVSDTGTGMDESVKEHIFEPFFTTKEKGKGTGLGLATVYGIVMQSQGTIWVYTEPGKGTTFKVYLPRIGDAAVDSERGRASLAPTGIETVLVVEDEEAVRKLAERILRAAGYSVIAAASGGEALRIIEQHLGPVDLLLTDVVMPQMSGRQLAETLVERMPHLKVLYMSGYTDNAIVHHGVLDPGTRFISKPFSGAELTRRVRDALDEPSASQR